MGAMNGESGEWMEQTEDVPNALNYRLLLPFANAAVKLLACDFNIFSTNIKEININCGNIQAL